ncbi:hypothetical protein GCM10007939_02300 [Amylibacter marinus]|uniref:Transposase n=1 Tax=Amylibacter marinus TaxID=1475483 RepID=A0ABQ5VS40_9RHOB|nr:hypothetical protein GCM10007939_02300 [Amylibacter marinus]
MPVPAMRKISRGDGRLKVGCFVYLSILVSSGRVTACAERPDRGSTEMLNNWIRGAESARLNNDNFI